MARPNTNLSERQIDAIESILTLGVNDLRASFLPISGRTHDALVRGSILERTAEQQWQLTNYGIQSYCATILTKYSGATHERIHSALNNYQRLFN